MKELPKVYVSPIDKDLRNNKDMFYSKLLDPKKDTKDIMREIDKIFHSRNFVYKSKVEITTNDEILEATMVGKNQSSLLTLDGKSIPIATIKDIKQL